MDIKLGRIQLKVFYVVRSIFDKELRTITRHHHQVLKSSGVFPGFNLFMFAGFIILWRINNPERSYGG